MSRSDSVPAAMVQLPADKLEALRTTHTRWEVSDSDDAQATLNLIAAARAVVDAATPAASDEDAPISADHLRRAVLQWASRFIPGDRWDTEDVRDLETALGGTVENRCHHRSFDAASVPAADILALRDENASLLAQVERLQSRLIKAEEPRPTQPIDDFGGNIRSMYIRVSEGWLRRFDKWRKTKGLSRSGAIRKLVQDAWEADQ